MKQVIRLPRPSEVQFFEQVFDYDLHYEVKASYKTKGPCFSVGMSARLDYFDRRHKEKEIRGRLQRAAYAQLLENITAHLAVINPVDND